MPNRHSMTRSGSSLFAKESSDQYILRKKIGYGICGALFWELWRGSSVGESEGFITPRSTVRSRPPPQDAVRGRARSAFLFIYQLVIFEDPICLQFPNLATFPREGR